MALVGDAQFLVPAISAVNFFVVTNGRALVLNGQLKQRRNGVKNPFGFGLFQSVGQTLGRNLGVPPTPLHLYITQAGHHFLVQ